MKKLFSFCIIASAIVFFNPANAQQKAKWAELDNFHAVMSTTFHPAEEGKLEPIRTRSQEMVDKAVAWKNSDAPEGYNKDAVKKTLKDLVKGAKELHKMVQDNASDVALTEKLTNLHDVFHQIVEKCRTEEHH
ncbi:MAG: hypothetical protein HZB42_10765 [Sphingobacteriales bacterium]|nr:hypothetical protein [Sphingobacteriales bacterium]